MLYTHRNYDLMSKDIQAYMLEAEAITIWRITI